MATTYTEIPLRTDLGAYEMSVVLSGVVYILSFRYNARMGRWMMDINNAANEPLLVGLPLLVSFPMTYRFVGRIDGLPGGQFMVIDETGQERIPGRDNLGEDIKLIYSEEQ